MISSSSECNLSRAVFDVVSSQMRPFSLFLPSCCRQCCVARPNEPPQHQQLTPRAPLSQFQPQSGRARVSTGPRAPETDGLNLPYSYKLCYALAMRCPVLALVHCNSTQRSAVSGIQARSSMLVPSAGVVPGVWPRY
eukprot:3335049-Rhodomonas_salina.2